MPENNNSASPKFKIRGRAVTFLILIVIIIGAGAVAILARYSATSNAVCASCHPEHIDLWKESNGHPANLTDCHQCHSKKFEALPNSANIFRHYRDQLAPPEYLADDDLTNQRCLDCHENVLSWGYEIQKKIVTFSHRIHYLEDCTCISCHRTAGHITMKDSTNRPTIWECVDCHRKEFQGPPAAQKCLNCHDVLLVPGKFIQNKMK
ncbi:MAG: NapC/NirT family cytochrome c [Candidatus Aminicenantes bacterium]|nr:NapC/NirT family cytochrome c [Candidatus Aminicenantes bacterium]